MSERKQKKGLQALLNKQQKKKGNAQNTTSSKKEDEEPTNATLGIKQDPSVDAESPELPKQDTSAAAKANDGGEDSSDDDLNYAVSVGNKIVEQQNDSSKEQEVVQADYMMKKDEKEKDGAQAQKEKPKRNDASNIKFGGGRPMFNRNRKNVAGIGGDDFVGIDEIDDEGKKKESQMKRTAANGGIEFKNLSSTAVAGKKFEEEKEKESKPAERPRFFGKAKIGGGGAENKQNTGTNITYDFGVKFASQNKDDKPKNTDGKKDNRERKDDSKAEPEVRKDKRRINQNQEKNRFGAKDQGLDDQDLEDGFEVVNDRNLKRRQQRVQARTLDEDGEQQKDEAPKASQIRRGGAFGNLAGNDSD